MLRNPKKEEFKDCAKLIHISGPELFKYMYNQTEESILTLIYKFISNLNTTFSYDKVIIDEYDGSVRGLVLAHPAKDLKKFLINEIKHMKSIWNILGLFSRVGLVAKFPKLNNDEYFISNIAVFKEFRGKGISKKLLNRVLQDSKQLGFTKVSLYVEIDNDIAFKVYKNYGFKEEKSVQFPKRYNKYGLKGFTKMVLNI